MLPQKKKATGGGLAAAAAALEDNDELELGSSPLGDDPELDEYDLESDVFSSEMAKAFPELADDPARMEAFKAGIEAAVRTALGED